MIKGKIGHFRGSGSFRSQKHTGALFKLNSPVGNDTKTDLGTREILHNGDGTTKFFFHRTDVLYGRCKICSNTVRKIKSENTHPGLGQSQKALP